MKRPRGLLPMYQCKEMAREITRLLNLSPGLDWNTIDMWYAPQFPGMDNRRLQEYPEHLRPLIATAIERELKHRHVWRP
jgi:hypothetical protein